jgi:5-methylcytosine-specific restriction enzyme A
MWSVPNAAPYVHSCGAVVPAGGRCPTCTKAQDQARGSSSERGYDHGWRQLRARFLAKHPMCQIAGCGTHAVEVDHIITIRSRPELRLSWSNLRALCKHHHSQRTMTDQNLLRASERGR